MTYKKFLEKLETFVTLVVLSTKNKEAKKQLREIVKLIILFRLGKDK